jgi:hypothetical protein
MAAFGPKEGVKQPSQVTLALRVAAARTDAAQFVYKMFWLYRCDIICGNNDAAIDSQDARNSACDAYEA